VPGRRGRRSPSREQAGRLHPSATTGARGVLAASCAIAAMIRLSAAGSSGKASGTVFTLPLSQGRRRLWRRAFRKSKPANHRSPGTLCALNLPGGDFYCLGRSGHACKAECRCPVARIKVVIIEPPASPQKLLLLDCGQREPKPVHRPRPCRRRLRKRPGIPRPIACGSAGLQDGTGFYYVPERQRAGFWRLLGLSPATESQMECSSEPAAEGAVEFKNCCSLPMAIRHGQTGSGRQSRCHFPFTVGIYPHRFLVRCSVPCS